MTDDKLESMQGACHASRCTLYLFIGISVIQIGAMFGLSRPTPTRTITQNVARITHFRLFCPQPNLNFLTEKTTHFSKNCPENGNDFKIGRNLVLNSEISV
jgi:hypothetical protein